MTIMMQKLSLQQLEGSALLGQIKMNGSLYKEKYNQVNHAAALTDASYPSLPIPHENCVPTMASNQQIDLYESMLISPNMTMSSLLSAFSYSLIQSKLIGKQEFLIDFLDEITLRNINFDLGVICCDIDSQDALAQVCERNDFNFEKLSILAPNTKTFGLVIKMRKRDRAKKPVTRTEVDAVMVYDSAIPYPESVFKQLQSVSSRYPYQRIYLTTMDTPDIRVLCSSDIKDWNTKLSDLSPQTKTKLFLQKNRRPSLAHVKTWNKHLAEDVAAWAANRAKEPYQFEFPETPQELNRIYQMFPLHHPLITTKKEEVAVEESNADEEEDMDIEDDKSQVSQVVVNTAIPEKKRPLEQDENIPNKKQKENPDVDMDYDDLLKQALAAFENEINQL